MRKGNLNAKKKMKQKAVSNIMRLNKCIKVFTYILNGCKNKEETKMETKKKECD